MPEARDAAPSALGGSAALRAATAEAAAGLAGDGGLAGPELLKLAASLRMNTGKGGGRGRQKGKRGVRGKRVATKGGWGVGGVRGGRS
jgi:hypothetical protein